MAAVKLKYGFSDAVIAENTQLLIEAGKTPEEAARLATLHANNSKKKLSSARGDSTPTKG